MTIFLENVLLLLQQKGVSKNKMLTDLKLGKNSFVNWENRGTIPGGDTLHKISEYFNVSTDYLLGNETQDKQLEGIDFALMSESEELTVEQKNSVLNYIRFLKSGDNNKEV